MATRILKLAEARAPGSKETKLLAVWSTGEVTECSRASERITSATDIECDVRTPNVPVVVYYTRLGELGNLGYQVKTLFDSEVITTASEIGDIQTLIKGEQVP